MPAGLPGARDPTAGVHHLEQAGQRPMWLGQDSRERILGIGDRDGECAREQRGEGRGAHGSDYNGVIARSRRLRSNPAGHQHQSLRGSVGPQAIRRITSTSHCERAKRPKQSRRSQATVPILSVFSVVVGALDLLTQTGDSLRGPAYTLTRRSVPVCAASRASRRSFPAHFAPWRAMATACAS